MRAAMTAAIGFSALLAAAPLSAQPKATSAAHDSEIVVQADRDRERQIKRFVDALTPAAPYNGQIARFDFQVCPAVVGLAPAQNDAVAERMRRVAEAAGIGVADRSKCRPNALVMITRDKEELIKALRRKHPVFFYDQAGRPLIIPKQTGPVTAWQVEGRLAGEGRNISMDEFENYYVVESPGASSRLRPATHPHFIASVVVIQLSALDGLTTTQVADYAAMRAFARTDPARLKPPVPPTILTVVEAPMDSEVPVTLTELDLSFLKALYASPNGHYAGRQRHEIRRLVKNDLKRSRPAEPR
jgi:hypothetical protein